MGYLEDIAKASAGLFKEATPLVPPPQMSSQINPLIESANKVNIAKKASDLGAYGMTSGGKAIGDIFTTLPFSSEITKGIGGAANLVNEGISQGYSSAGKLISKVLPSALGFIPAMTLETMAESAKPKAADKQRAKALTTQMDIGKETLKATQKKDWEKKKESPLGGAGTWTLQELTPYLRTAVPEIGAFAAGTVNTALGGLNYLGRKGAETIAKGVSKVTDIPFGTPEEVQQYYDEAAKKQTEAYDNINKLIDQGKFGIQNILFQSDEGTKGLLDSLPKEMVAKIPSNVIEDMKNNKIPTNYSIDHALNKATREYKYDLGLDHVYDQLSKDKIDLSQAIAASDTLKTNLEFDTLTKEILFDPTNLLGVNLGKIGEKFKAKLLPEITKAVEKPLQESIKPLQEVSKTIANVPPSATVQPSISTTIPQLTETPSALVPQSIGQRTLAKEQLQPSLKALPAPAPSSTVISSPQTPTSLVPPAPMEQTIQVVQPQVIEAPIQAIPSQAPIETLPVPEEIAKPLVPTPIETVSSQQSPQIMQGYEKNQEYLDNQFKELYPEASQIGEEGKILRNWNLPNIKEQQAPSGKVKREAYPLAKGEETPIANIKFGSQLERALFESSLPRSKEYAKALGMPWEEYQNYAKDARENLKPLAKQLFGEVTDQNLSYLNEIANTSHYGVLKQLREGKETGNLVDLSRINDPEASERARKINELADFSRVSKSNVGPLLPPVQPQQKSLKPVVEETKPLVPDLIETVEKTTPVKVEPQQEEFLQKYESILDANDPDLPLINRLKETAFDKTGHFSDEVKQFANQELTRIMEEKLTKGGVSEEAQSLVPSIREPLALEAPKPQKISGLNELLSSGEVRPLPKVEETEAKGLVPPVEPNKDIYNKQATYISNLEDEGVLDSLRTDTINNLEENAFDLKYSLKDRQEALNKLIKELDNEASKKGVQLPKVEEIEAKGLVPPVEKVEPTEGETILQRFRDEEPVSTIPASEDILTSGRDIFKAFEEQNPEYFKEVFKYNFPQTNKANLGAFDERSLFYQFAKNNPEYFNKKWNSDLTSDEIIEKLKALEKKGKLGEAIDVGNYQMPKELKAFEKGATDTESYASKFLTDEEGAKTLNALNLRGHKPVSEKGDYLPEAYQKAMEADEKFIPFKSQLDKLKESNPALFEEMKGKYRDLLEEVQSLVPPVSPIKKPLALEPPKAQKTSKLNELPSTGEIRPLPKVEETEAKSLIPPIEAQPIQPQEAPKNIFDMISIPKTEKSGKPILRNLKPSEEAKPLVPSKTSLEQAKEDFLDNYEFEMDMLEPSEADYPLIQKLRKVIFEGKESPSRVKTALENLTELMQEKLKKSKNKRFKEEPLEEVD